MIRTKLDSFRLRCRQFSWLAVFMGQGVMPQAYDPLADVAPLAEIQKTLADYKTLMSRVVSGMPSHEAFIERNCKAPPLPM